MSPPKYPPRALADRPPQPKYPRRMWDILRCVWIEAATRVRRPNGRFGRKNGTEPDAQLSLFETARN